MSRSVVVEVFSTKMNDWSAAPIHKLGGNVYCEIAEGQRYRVCAIDTTSRDAVIDLRVDGHHTVKNAAAVEPFTFCVAQPGERIDAAAASKVGSISVGFYRSERVETPYTATTWLPDYGRDPETKGKLLVTQGIGTAVPSAGKFGQRSSVQTITTKCSALLHEITILARERSALELLGVVKAPVRAPAPSSKRKSAAKSSTSSSSSTSAAAPAAAAAASQSSSQIIHSEMCLSDDGTALVRDFARLLVQRNDGDNMGTQAHVEVPLVPVVPVKRKKSSQPAQRGKSGKRAKPSTALFDDDDDDEIQCTSITMGGVEVQQMSLRAEEDDDDDAEDDDSHLVELSAASTAPRQVVAGYTLSMFVAAAMQALSSSGGSDSAPSSSASSSETTVGGRVWLNTGAEVTTPQELLDATATYFVVDASSRAKFRPVTAL